MNVKENDLLSAKKGGSGLGKPPYHSTKNSGGDAEAASPAEPTKKHSGGIIANQLGIKLKKQPPKLPQNFEQSPLFETGATSQYFRLQPKDTQQTLFNKTIKMASEA